MHQKNGRFECTIVILITNANVTLITSLLHDQATFKRTRSTFFERAPSKDARLGPMNSYNLSELNEYCKNFANKVRNVFPIYSKFREIMLHIF